MTHVATLLRSHLPSLPLALATALLALLLGLAPRTADAQQQRDPAPVLRGGAEFFERALPPAEQARVRAFRERAERHGASLEQQRTDRRALDEKLEREAEQRDPARQAAFETRRAARRAELQRRLAGQYRQDDRSMQANGGSLAGAKPPFSFTASPNADIPDGDPAGITSTITVPEGSGEIEDLDVPISISHNYVGDLSITLEHVDTGTSVTLVDRPGVPESSFGCNGDDIDVILDDEGTAGSIPDDCTDGGPAYLPEGGRFVPNGDLSAFDEESLDGEWVLTVADNASFAAGVLETWGLEGETAENVPLPTALVVNSALDGLDNAPGDGVCSTGSALPSGEPECTLRAAIQEANAIEADANADAAFQITFDIPSPDEGGFAGGYDAANDTWTVMLNDDADQNGALPVMQNDSLTLDASTQTAGGANFEDAACETLLLGQEHNIKVMIDGSALPASDALVIQAPANTVRGLAIGNTPGSGLSTSTASGLTVECNYIGTEHDGLTAAGNGAYGVDHVNSTGGNVFNNVLSGNVTGGVRFLFVADGLIESNVVGTGVDLSTPLPNASGIRLWASSTGNEVFDNLVAGNTDDGINIEDPNTNLNMVLGNAVGLALGDSGFVPLGNGDGDDGDGGITFDFGATNDNLITSNAIAYNGGPGIRFADGAAEGNNLSQNAFFQNDGPGIDLGGDGVTTNDDGDSDDGANRLQNYPEIAEAQYDADSETITITYAIPSDPAATGAGASVFGPDPISTEFYVVDDGAEEGRVFIGEGSYATADYDACGTPPCTITEEFDAAGLTTIFGEPVSVSQEDRIVALAIDGAGNTSEFSDMAKRLPVELAGGLTGKADGRDAVLSWQTQVEDGNAGFHVQHRHTNEGQEGAAAWERVTASLIEGAGTTSEPQRYTYRVEDLAYGAHEFRLVQFDRDGARTVHGESLARVEVSLEATYTLEGIYPNPMRSRATVEFAVREAQPVTVALYDALGRQVRVLHQGEVPASETIKLSLEAGGLASGVYFLRIAGREFVASESVTLVR